MYFIGGYLLGYTVKAQMYKEMHVPHADIEVE